MEQASVGIHLHYVLLRHLNVHHVLVAHLHAELLAILKQEHALLVQDVKRQIVVQHLAQTYVPVELPVQVHLVEPMIHLVQQIITVQVAVVGILVHVVQLLVHQVIISKKELNPQQIQNTVIYGLIQDLVVNTVMGLETVKAVLVLLLKARFNILVEPVSIFQHHLVQAAL